MVMGERIDKQRIGYYSQFFLDVMGKDVHQFYQSLYFSIFFKIYIINLCKFLYEFFLWVIIYHDIYMQSASDTVRASRTIN